MPSHWGHTRLNIVSRLEPDRHAGAAGGRRGGSRRHLQPRRRRFRIASRASTPTKSSTSRSAKARRAKANSGKRSTPRAPSSCRCSSSSKTTATRSPCPVEVQTPGGDISRLVRSFPGLHVDSIDGTDFFASLRAMREAADYVRARKGPAFVHARVIRPYSHSLSDDEKLYKPPAEREAEARRDPIARFREFLRRNGLATDDELAAIDADVDREMNEAALTGARRAEAAEDAARRCWVYSPDVDPASSAFDTPAAARRQARHDGRRRSTARSRTKWRATRASSCSARTSPTRAREKRCRSSRAKAASSS